jgi:hypothetical protein
VSTVAWLRIPAKLMVDSGGSNRERRWRIAESVHWWAVAGEVGVLEMAQEFLYRRAVRQRLATVEVLRKAANRPKREPVRSGSGSKRNALKTTRVVFQGNGPA